MHALQRSHHPRLGVRLNEGKWASTVLIGNVLGLKQMQSKKTSVGNIFAAGSPKMPWAFARFVRVMATW